jgi:hypothetical protein
MKLRMSRASTRLAGLATLAVVGSLSAAVPAFAADEQADLSVSVAASTVAVGAPKFMSVRIDNHGPATARGISVTIDVSGLDTSKVGVQNFGVFLAGEVVGQSGTCDTNGTKATCTLDQLPDGAHEEAQFELDGLAAGDAGSFSASVSSSGTTDPDTTNNTVKQSLTVRDVGDAVDMIAVAWDLYENSSERIPVMAGTTASLTFAMINGGTATASGVEVTITLPEHTAFAVVPSICDLNTARTVATCTDKEAVVPYGFGFVVDPDTFRVRVDDDAPAPAGLTGGVVKVEALGQAPAAASAPRPHLAGFSPDTDTVIPPAEVDNGDNTDAYTVFTAKAQPIDMSAHTTPAEGTVGGTVEVRGVVSNDSSLFAPNVLYTVVAPSGTQLTSRPVGCRTLVPGHKYVCRVGELEPMPSENHAWPVGISLKIVSANVGDDGYLSVTSEAKDPNPANNVAKIVLTVKGSGGGEGGGLPITGAKAGLIGGTGGAVLLAGLAVLVMARRRRVVMVTPTDGAGG